ncbi:hypothetical protein BGX26_002536 [Mortierella sp. AD094]|nr:hypothetical protein BGX26_002536 [Mortierella sp. AD094]
MPPAADVTVCDAPKTKTTTITKKAPKRKAAVKKAIVESSNKFQLDSEEDYQPSDSNSPDRDSDIGEGKKGN